MLSREEHARALAKILEQAKNPADVSELLTQIGDSYGTALAEQELSKTEAENMKRRNHELTEQNMKLFLKVGGVPETKPDEPPKKMSFDDLFDEHGKLK